MPTGWNLLTHFTAGNTFYCCSERTPEGFLFYFEGQSDFFPLYAVLFTIMSDDPRILGRENNQRPPNSATAVSFNAISQSFDVLHVLHFNYVVANEEYQQSV